MELFAYGECYPYNFGFVIPSAVPKIIEELRRGLCPWPILSLHWYTRHDPELAKIEFRRIAPCYTPGYELRPDDLQYITPHLYSWFIFDVEVLQLAPRLQCAFYYPLQLQALLRKLRNTASSNSSGQEESESRVV